MERLGDITFITTEYVRDAIGQEREVEVGKGPFCVAVNSISRQEWTAAGQQGLKPACMLRLPDSDDYSGETTIKVENCPGVKPGRYSVYRTYLTDDGGIELYIREDAGS